MSNPCGKCKRKPAFWHPQTLTYLCGGCIDAYRKAFHRELREDLRDREARLSGPAAALYWAAIVAASALLWAVFVFALGVTP
jgi:hypothetical protein